MSYSWTAHGVAVLLGNKLKVVLKGTVKLIFTLLLFVPLVASISIKNDSIPFGTLLSQCQSLSMPPLTF